MQGSQKPDTHDWVLVEEQSNAADLIFFYTFFTKIPHRINMFQKSSMREIGDGRIALQQRWVNHEFGGETTEEDSFVIYDCRDKRYGFLKEGVRGTYSDDDIKWYGAADNPYVQKSEIPVLLEKFAAKCKY